MKQPIFMRCPCKCALHCSPIRLSSIQATGFAVQILLCNSIYEYSTRCRFYSRLSLHGLPRWWVNEVYSSERAVGECCVGREIGPWQQVKDMMKGDTTTKGNKIREYRETSVFLPSCAVADEATLTGAGICPTSKKHFTVQ